MVSTSKRVLVTGATGFIGHALIPALLDAGYTVRATTREKPPAKPRAGVEWVNCDVHDLGDVRRALRGVDAAYWLVHEMASGSTRYARTEQRTARQFASAAAEERVGRIVYLGGVAPSGEPSKHLASRLAVGEILRHGAVPTLELRASMIVGAESASWKIVRDLALRLPAMLLPPWTESRTRPLALTDAVHALVAGLEVPLAESAWYDIAGPDTLNARQILETVAGIRGRRLPSLSVPGPGVQLSSYWLKLVTGVDFALARELVRGFGGDLLPVDDRYWALIGKTPAVLVRGRCARSAVARALPVDAERRARARGRSPGAGVRAKARRYSGALIIEWRVHPSVTGALPVRPAWRDACRTST